jgi:hypothetical protein
VFEYTIYTRHRPRITARNIRTITISNPRPLNGIWVIELVCRHASAELSDRLAKRICERSGGGTFFWRESALQHA